MQHMIYVLLLSFLILLDGVRAQMAVSPDPPIFHAPFRVSTTDPTITGVFVSTNAGCSDIVGSALTLVGGTAILHVTESDETGLHLCNSLTSTQVVPLAFEKISFSPRYLFLNTPSTLRFSSITPVNSVVQLRQFPDCATGSVQFEDTIPSSREVTFTTSNAVYYYVCVQFVSDVTNQFITLNTGQLVVTDVVNFTPNVAITHETVLFQTFGAAPPQTQVKLSSNSDCLDVVEGPARTGGASGKEVDIKISAEKGTYAFCIETPLNSGIFVTGGDLTVSQYGVLATTVIATMVSPMRVTLDSPFGTGVVLSPSSGCTQPYVLGPTTSSLGSGIFTWNVQVAGIYYACVQKPLTTTYLLANAVEAISPYIVTVPSEAVVRGLVLSINVRNAVGLHLSLSSLGTCESIVSGITDDEGNWKVVLPIAETLSHTSLSVCVKVPDNTSEYPVSQIDIRSFNLEYPALITGRSIDFVVDDSTPITAEYRISTSSSCNDGTAADVPATRIITTQFTTAGVYHLCVKTAVEFIHIRPFTVEAMVSASPNEIIADVEFSIVFSQTFTGQLCFISESCSNPNHVVNATTTGSSLTLQYAGASPTTLSQCAVYRNSSNSPIVVEVGTMTVFKLSHSPTVFIINRVSRVIITGSYTNGIGSVAYLTQRSKTCTAPNPSDTQGTMQQEGSDHVFEFASSSLGEFVLCLQIADGRYVSSGNVSVIAPMTIGINENPNLPHLGVHLRGLPLQFSIDQPYIPKKMALSYSVDCKYENVSGTFNSVGLSSVMVPESTGNLTLCVSSDDGITLLPVSYVIVETATITSTTLINSINNSLGSVPNLISANFSVALSKNDGCNPVVTARNPLNVDTGLYFMCGSMSFNGVSYTTRSENKLAVVDGFSVAVVDGVKAQVPAEYTLSGGDVDTGSQPNRMYFVMKDKPCVYDGIPPVSFSAENKVSTAISTRAGETVSVCVTTKDMTNTFKTIDVTPLPYMFPTSLLKGTPRDVTSGLLETGVAKISPNETCGDAWWGPTQFADHTIPAVNVPEAAGEVAHLCESIDDGNSWIDRGTITLLTKFNPTTNPPPTTESPDGEPTQAPPQTGDPGTTPSPDASTPEPTPAPPILLDNVTVAPGTPFEIGVPGSAGRDPYLSRKGDCSTKVDVPLGYVPFEGELSLFFVCITSPDGSIVYTNPYPSVNVSHYSISPRTIRSATNESVSLLPVSPQSKIVFASRHSTCANRIGPLDMSSGEALLNIEPGQSGLYWMCVSNGDSWVNVASFIVVDAPKVTQRSNKVARSVFCVNVVVPNSLYSMADNSGSLSQYFTSTKRSLFLASSCASSPLSTAPIQSGVNGNFSVCLPTGSNVPLTVRLCAATPGGIMSVEDVKFKTVTLSPSTFVSGTKRQTTISSVGAATLGISQSSSCASLAAPTFTTSGDGKGTLSTIGESKHFIDSGLYYLCYRGHDGNFYNVASLSVTPAVYFSGSVESVLQGVETSVTLLQDLTSAHLVEGLFLDTDCNDKASNSKWTRLSNKSVAVFSTLEPSTLYLCAVAPVNGSRVVGTSFALLQPTVQFPSRAAACSPFSVGVPADNTDIRIVLADSSCCTSQQPKLVAEAERNSNGLRTLTVSGERMDFYAPQTRFHLCYWAPQTCLELGPIDVITNLCGSQGSNSTVIVSPDDTAFIGGAAPNEEDTDYTPLSILLIAFIVVIVIAVLICVVHHMMKGRKVVPVDETPAEEMQFDEKQSKRTFDDLFSSNRLKGPKGPIMHSILNVPIDMKLDICHEMPLCLQQLFAEEEQYRVALEESQAYVYDQLSRSIANESFELQSYMVAVERARVLHEMQQAFEIELEELENSCDLLRHDIAVEEEEQRLALAELERSLWREEMQLEGQRLRNVMERDPYWRERRARLREASSRAMSSLSNTSPLPRGQVSQLFGTPGQEWSQFSLRTPGDDSVFKSPHMRSDPSRNM